MSRRTGTVITQILLVIALVISSVCFPAAQMTQSQRRKQSKTNNGQMKQTTRMKKTTKEQRWAAAARHADRRAAQFRKHRTEGK